jgi:hypothetical protein
MTPPPAKPPNVIVAAWDAASDDERREFVDARIELSLTAVIGAIKNKAAA